MKSLSTMVSFFVLSTLLYSYSPLKAEFAEEWFRPPTQTEDPLFDEGTLKKLYALEVNVQWNNIDIQSAIKDLSTQCKALDSDHLGVKFTLTKMPERKTVYDRTGGTSVMGAILAIVLQNNLTVKIHKNEVILTPSTEKPRVGL